MSEKITNLSEFAKALAADTREHVDRKIKEAIEPLLARIKTLEERPHALKYCGVWSEGAFYRQGDGVSKKGLWVAVVDTHAKPGESADWRLVLRDGRDGRDGKDLTR